MTKPTPRQAEALRLIAHSIRERGFAPSMRELCIALGVSSTNAVNDLLCALDRKGSIKRGPPSARRAIAVTRSGYEFIGWATPVDDRFHAIGHCQRCGAQTFAHHPYWLCKALAMEAVA